MEAQIQIFIASTVQVVSFTPRPLYLRRKCPENLLDKTHVGHRDSFEDMWGTEVVLKTCGAQRLFWRHMWGTELVLKTRGHRACFEDTCGAQMLFWRYMWGTEVVLKTCGVQSLFWRHMWGAELVLKTQVGHRACFEGTKKQNIGILGFHNWAVAIFTG